MPKRLVNSLPFDSCRCDPAIPDAYCRSCVRWDRAEGQTWGGRTPVQFGLDNSTSEGCSYIAATWEELGEEKEETK